MKVRCFCRVSLVRAIKLIILVTQLMCLKVIPAQVDVLYPVEICKIIGKYRSEGLEENLAAR